MSFLQLIVPTLGIAYFLYRSKKTPVYLCGIPLFYAFMHSAFFNTVVKNIFILNINNQDILFFLVAVSWAYIRQKRSLIRKIEIGIDTISIYLFLIIIIISVPIGWIFDNYLKFGALLIARWFLYIPISYFLWMDIFRRSSQAEVIAVLKDISYISIPLIFMFVLSALGFNIYPYEKYYIKTTYDYTIIRDFQTYPYWAALALPFFLSKILTNAKLKEIMGAYLFIFILIFGTFFSLTRSVSVLQIFLVLITIIFVFYRQKNPIKLGIRLSVLVGIVLFAIIGFFVFSPEYSRLFSLRFYELKFIQGNNLYSRLLMFQDVYNWVSQNNWLFGFGFNNIIISSGNLMEGSPIPLINAYWGDFMWNGIVMPLGLIGLLSLCLVLIYGNWQAFKLLFVDNDKKAEIGIFLFLFLFNNLIMTLIGPGYLLRSSVSMLPFAMISIETRNLWATSPATSPFPKIIFLSPQFSRFIRPNSPIEFIVAIVTALLVVRFLFF